MTARALLAEFVRALTRPPDHRAQAAPEAARPRGLREVSDEEMLAAIERLTSVAEQASSLDPDCNDADCDCGGFSRLRYTPRKKPPT